MADNDERKLEIRIAQLNAYLQVALWAFVALVAGAIALAVLEYQLRSDQVPLKILVGIFALLLLGIAGYFLFRLYQYLDAFKNLK
jgi:membrane protein DedA with SNARE-associated domain